MIKEILKFDTPEKKTSFITIIGIGGGGCTAVHDLYEQGIKGEISYVLFDTDEKALQKSSMPCKIKLCKTTSEINDMLSEETKMVLIVSCFGGDTGSVNAPIIAKMARDKKILTIGIVSFPFQSEGHYTTIRASDAILKMHDCVDSLFIINNEKLHGDCKNIILREAFKNTDHILLNVANRMTETITLECINSIDFPDIKKVFIKGGISVMGIAVADDATGIICAVNEALDFPLFNIKPKNAKDILIHLISGTEEASMNEITDMVEYVQYCYPPSDLIWIIGKDISIGKKFSITVIATGLEF